MAVMTTKAKTSTPAPTGGAKQMNIDDAVSALHAQITAVCPIQGVSIGDLADKATWRIDYAPAATDPQKVAAQAVVTAFDTSLTAVPQSVTRWRLMKALRNTPFAGGTLYDAVSAAIAESGDTTLANQWAEVTEIVRGSVVVASLAGALGLDRLLVDNVFRLAGSYPA